jgi:hypothetical protein
MSTQKLASPDAVKATQALKYPRGDTNTPSGTIRAVIQPSLRRLSVAGVD